MASLGGEFSPHRVRKYNTLFHIHVHCSNNSWLFQKAWRLCPPTPHVLSHHVVPTGWLPFAFSLHHGGSSLRLTRSQAVSVLCFSSSLQDRKPNKSSFLCFCFLIWSLALSPRLEGSGQSWLTATSASQVQASAF